MKRILSVLSVLSVLWHGCELEPLFGQTNRTVVSFNDGYGKYTRLIDTAQSNSTYLYLPQLFSTPSMLLAVTQATGLGTSGQVLTSNGSGSLPHWTTPTTGTVTSIATQHGTTGGPITGTGTIGLTPWGTGSGTNAIAFGATATVNGNYSAIIGGQSNEANGAVSACIAGGNNITAGDGSATIGGDGLMVNGFAQVAIGQYNYADPPSTSRTSFVPSDKLLIGGNGSSGYASNSFSFDGQGNLTLGGHFGSSVGNSTGSIGFGDETTTNVATLKTFSQSGSYTYWIRDAGSNANLVTARATLTPYELVVGDLTGAAIGTLGTTGTAGNVLTSQGAGSVPDWAMPAAPISGNVGVLAGSTGYYCPTDVHSLGPNATNVLPYQMIVPYGHSCELLQFAVDIPPGTGKSISITIYYNGSATALTCTISGNSATTASEVSNTVTVAAGGILSMKITASAGCASTEMMWSFNMH